MAHCSAVIAAANAPVVLALFLGGLTGSISHCVGMCSPFVLAQINPTAPQKTMQSLLLPYHTGRLTTYMLLGAVAGVVFQALVQFSWFSVVSRLLLATAACLFLVALVGRVSKWLPMLPSWAPRCAMAQLQKLSQLPSAWQRFGLGMVLGLIPCGLVFAALMTVAASGSALTGMVGMAAFGLGTLPMLMAVGLAGNQLVRRAQGIYHYLTIAALAFNSLLLFTLAGS